MAPLKSKGSDSASFNADAETFASPDMKTSSSISTALPENVNTGADSDLVPEPSNGDGNFTSGVDTDPSLQGPHTKNENTCINSSMTPEPSNGDTSFSTGMESDLSFQEPVTEISNTCTDFTMIAEPLTGDIDLSMDMESDSSPQRHLAESATTCTNSDMVLGPSKCDSNFTSDMETDLSFQAPLAENTNTTTDSYMMTETVQEVDMEEYPQHMSTMLGEVYEGPQRQGQEKLRRAIEDSMTTEMEEDADESSENGQFPTDEEDSDYQLPDWSDTEDNLASSDLRAMVGCGTTDNETEDTAKDDWQAEDYVTRAEWSDEA